MKRVLSLIFAFGIFFWLHQVARAQIHFTAKLDGAQEVPAVTTTATGTGSFTLNSTGTELSYHITFTGLSGSRTASHFHNGPAGVAAGVVRDIAFTGNTASGVWKRTDATQPLTEALVRELLSGRLYVNLHTAANPGGEIRGQVLVDYGIGLTAKLDGAQEVPPVTTTGTGTGSFTLKSSSSGTVTELEYHITFTGLS
ncbi:MAG: CHRD domain-containing protein, partial [bacterium]